VVLDGQLAISLLDLVGTGVLGNTKDCVWVFLAHGAIAAVVGV
jgi:hypothetical protein